MSRSNAPPEADLAALVHALEVHQAELEVMNHELAATNEELRHNNAALVVARDRYSALHELAPIPLITVDVRGTILEVNSAAEVMLHETRAGLIDRRFAIFAAEAARAQVGALLRDLFVAGELHGVELVLAPVDHAPVDVVVDAAVIRDDADGPAHAVLALVDVTARKRAGDAQRLESLIALAGGIAHSFNNLMTVIVVGTDGALEKVGADSPIGEALLEANEAAHRAGALAHQMLAYTGRRSVPTCAMDPGRMLRELEPVLVATAVGTQLVVELEDALPWIVANEAQLRQLLVNVVTNAAEATQGRDGPITLNARVDGPRLVIEVTDRGVGMDPATQARIFEPYFSTKFAGRGLGMAVVDGVVRSHCGTITIDSEPGRGTTVRLSLPTSPRPPTAIPTAGAGWHASTTVLLVDDEAAVLRTMARVLRRFGLTVVTAVDGADAVELCRDEQVRVDLVLMDLTMPKLDGVSAAREIHTLRPGLPIVLITGFGEIPAGASALFVEVLSKPASLDALRAVLERHLPAAATDPP